MKSGDLVEDIETGAIGIIIQESYAVGSHTYIQVYFGPYDPYSKYKTPYRISRVTIQSLRKVI